MVKPDRVVAHTLEGAGNLVGHGFLNEVGGEAEVGTHEPDALGGIFLEDVVTVFSCNDVAILASGSIGTVD